MYYDLSEKTKYNYAKYHTHNLRYLPKCWKLATLLFVTGKTGQPNSGIEKNEHRYSSKDKSVSWTLKQHSTLFELNESKKL